MTNILREITLSFFAFSLAGNASAVPVETVLHSFTGGSDGAYPDGLIPDSNGNLYGTAIGSVDGYGVVYMLSPPSAYGGTWTETVLHTFTDTAFGVHPEAGLLADSRGNFYGTATGGTSVLCFEYPSGCGVAFELSPPSTAGGIWTETVLHTFEGDNGEFSPSSGLIADSKGNLYGTTEGYGDRYGTVFELSPPAAGTSGWTETVLDNFSYYSSGGAYPYGGLIADSKGNLFGTAFGLYVPQASGSVVFELTPPTTVGGAWTENVLGSGSNSGLIADGKGNLYGTRPSGGASGSGVLFKLSPPAVADGAWTETVLYTFSGGSDGGLPVSGLLADSNGNLFGTTAFGGASTSQFASGGGVAFKLSPPAISGGAWTETVLHTFTGGADGDVPNSSLIADRKGNLYGTTGGGGMAGFGTVFELTNTGFVTNVPFAAFRSNLEIHFGKRPNKDAFELFSEFTLGSASTGINPLTDPVTLTIGTYTASIPPGSFRKERNGPFIFAGIINGADLEARIAQTGEKRFEFAAEARKADLAGTTNPVPVTLTIGNNTGTDSIKHPERGW